MAVLVDNVLWFCQCIGIWKGNGLVVDFNKYGCLTPWHEMYIQPTGKIKSCCAAFTDTEFTSEKSMAENFNHEHYRSMRRDMIAGLPPKGCAGCYEKEEQFGYSLRLYRNSNRYLDKLGTIDKDDQLLFDLDAYKQTFTEIQDPKQLKVLKIDFSNGCNLRCPMCSPRKSTSWFKDKLAIDAEGLLDNITLPGRPGFTYTPFSQIKAPLTTELMEEYSRTIPTEWIDENLEILLNLSSIEVSGGEPFFHPQFLYLLDKLIEAEWKGTLRIITNLTLITSKHITKLTHFKQVNIIASIDACGKLHEYIRPSVPVGKYNWKDIENTIISLNTMNNLSLNLNFVSQALNFYNTEEWFAFLERIGIRKGNGFNVLSKPQWLRTNVFPDQDEKKKLALKLTDRYTGTPYEDAVKIFSNQFNQPHNPDDWRAFCIYMNFLDRQRKTSIMDYIPEFERHWIYE